MMSSFADLRTTPCQSEDFRACRIHNSNICSEDFCTWPPAPAQSGILFAGRRSPQHHDILIGNAVAYLLNGALYAAQELLDSLETRSCL